MKRSSFVGKTRTITPREDEVFYAAVKAQQAIAEHGINQVINGTLGSLYDDDFKLITFKTVYETYASLPSLDIARYASDLLAPVPFAQAMAQWLFQDHAILHRVIATPGASGAIAMAFKNGISPGDTVLIPTPSWGPYNAIATEANVLVQTYPLFHEGQFDLTALQAQVHALLKRQSHVMIVINDPAQNPTGYTLSDADWLAFQSMIKASLPFGRITLLLDVAYLDYASNVLHYADHFNVLAHLSPECLVLIAFSGSKTLTAYGMRLGALIITGATDHDREQFTQACAYSVRGLWSVANSGAMALFAKIVNDPTRHAALRDELTLAQSLLKKRATLFLQEATLTQLPLYPFTEGFFIMMDIADAKHQALLHRQLMDDRIFTVATSGGLRLALCSIATHQLPGLAQRIEQHFLSSRLTLK